MRDKDRIHRIMMLLEKVWESQPDIRFQQLMANLKSIYANKYGYGERVVKENEPGEDRIFTDLFYVEDTEWEDFLHALLHEEVEEVEKESLELEPVTSHSDCSHFYINEKNSSILEALDLKNEKLYALYFDEYDDDYYIINEKGKRCYSIDVGVQVDMYKQVNA